MRQLLLALVLTSCLALPAAAGAATVSGSGATATLTAAPGERNVVTFVSDGVGLIVRDAGPAPVLGGGCERYDDTAVRCAGADASSRGSATVTTNSTPGR